MSRAFMVLAVLAGARLVRVSGTATHVHTTQPCKGGVRVTQEDFKHETTVLADQTFTIYRGGPLNTVQSPQGAPLKTFKTDGKGRFSVQLAPGTYCIMQGAPPPPRDGAEEAKAKSIGEGPPDQNHKGHPQQSPEPPQCDTVLPVDTTGESAAVIRVSSTNRCNGPWNEPGYDGPMPP
jgi:hypothetical protein